MNPDIFLYFSISCFSLCLILIIFSSFKNSKKVRDIKIPINQFVSKVLEWCSSNIGSHKQGYQVDLKYYRNNEFAGYYFNHTRTIKIFVYDELGLLDLTEIEYSAPNSTIVAEQTVPQKSYIRLFSKKP